jgi:hypothetical protein
LLPGRGAAGFASWVSDLSITFSGSTCAGAMLSARAALSASKSTPSSAANSAANSGFTSAVFLAAVFFAAAFLTGFFSSTGLASGYISMSLRTTGASTVDDAERTNSPISWSLARTTLLSIPSCFANSCTRTFDTFLLSWPAIFILDIYLGMRALVVRPHNLNELI